MKIEEARGVMREYSPMVVTSHDRCENICAYCPYDVHAHERDFDTEGMAEQAAKADRQVLLACPGDPFGPSEYDAARTLQILSALRENRCSVAILTRFTRTATAQMEMFSSWPDRRIRVGTSISHPASWVSPLYEPGTSSQRDRMEFLSRLHDCGVQTWAEITPVFSEFPPLDAITMSLPFVDMYILTGNGKIMRKSMMDSAANLIRAAKKRLYVTKSARKYMSEILPEEEVPDHHYLPARPENGGEKNEMQKVRRRRCVL